MTACFSICIAGGTAYGNAHFGAGSGQIFLDNVQCTSSANQLLECSSRPILSHNCLHSDDAGVGCEGSYCVLKFSTIMMSELYVEDYLFNIHCIHCLTFCCKRSAVYKWPGTTHGRQHWKWRQSGDLHEQSMGHCVWWLLGKCWCYCCVPAVGLLHPRWAMNTCLKLHCFSVALLCANRCSSL